MAVEIARHPVGEPVHPGGACATVRQWTAITIDAGSLMKLFGMPDGTKLISIAVNDLSATVTLTIEEPEDRCD